MGRPRKAAVESGKHFHICPSPLFGSPNHILTFIAAPLPSTFRSSRRSAKSKPSSDRIPNSDEDDELIKSTNSPARRSSFRGVYITPMDSEMASSSSSKRPTPYVSQSVSSASPLDTPESGIASDYQTPHTSGVGTPSGSTTAMKTSNGIAKGKGRKRNLGRRSNLSSEVAGDAELVQALQEEEFNGDAVKPTKKAIAGKRRKASSVVGSSDHDQEAVDLEMSSEEEPLAKKRKMTNGRSLKSPRDSSSGRSRLSLPSRSVRLKAQKGISKNASVDDSDESALSELDSDEVFDDSDESDADAASPVSSTPTSSVAGSSTPPTNGVTAVRGRSFGNFRRRFEMHRKLNRADRERNKLEKAHPEIKSMWDELEAIPRIPTEQAKQPGSITRTLKGFQLEGLNWLQKQEKTNWKGGLLGDEMGMGKTIQAVSLIMSDYPAKDPTLVVMPPVALMQWSNEIREYTNGKLKVLVYHGTNAKSKNLSVKQLKEFDVILISYPSLESIHRKEVKGWSRDDDIVKEESAIHAIHFHRLILDEAHNIKSRTTGVAKACFALKGNYKWTLSGTPVQNRIGEFCKCDPSHISRFPPRIVY